MKELLPGLRLALDTIRQFDIPTPDTCPPGIGLSEDQVKFAYAGSMVAQRNFCQILEAVITKAEELAKLQEERENGTVN